MGNPTYLISWGAAFLFLGALWYVIDRRVGAGWYRWFYNMTHREPMPASERRGFIFGQQAKTRFQVAAAASIVQSVAAMLTGEVHVLFEAVTIFVEVPALMAGFYLGPRIDRIWSKRDDLFETVDRLETGDLSVSGEVRRVSADAVESIKDVFTDDEEDSSPEPQKPATPVETPEEPEEDISNPRDLIKDYTERRGRDSE